MTITHETQTTAKPSDSPAELIKRLHDANERIKSLKESLDEKTADYYKASNGLNEATKTIASQVSEIEKLTPTSVQSFANGMIFLSLIAWFLINLFSFYLMLLQIKYHFLGRPDGVMFMVMILCSCCVFYAVLLKLQKHRNYVG